MSVPTTDQLRSAAIDALMAWHHACVRMAADDIREDLRHGRIADRDAAEESIQDWAESLCTYTFNAQLHLTASRHDGAYLEEYGDSLGIVKDGAIQWEMLATYAIEADIRDQLGDDVETILTANDAAGEDVL